MDAAVADIFGYHALQLGLPALDSLSCNRMPTQWLASDQPDAEPVAGGRATALYCDYSALPFPSSSLDLVVLAHTLDFAADPHAALREVERVLVPEGRVVITGLNPASLWGGRWRREYWPAQGELLGTWRLRDWLRLLGFEVEQHTFGGYRPALHSEKWLQRFDWLDALGQRWWPIFGACYFFVAVKRVRGMRVLGPAWKARPARARARKPVSVAHCGSEHRNDEGKI